MVMCITGCGALTGKSNITNLLSAPKLSKNESDIVDVIENYLGENITLRYSQTQGYSAPIQLIDINYDDVYEAVVFYYAPNKGTNIRFALLSYSSEGWDIVFDKEGLGTEVFYFDTIVLPQVWGKQLIVGYQPTNIDENFFVTYFTDTDKAVEDYVESCSDIATGDMDGNGYSDVILTKRLYNNNISVSVLTFDDSLTFANAGTRMLKYADVDITQMAINYLPQGGKALYIDYSDNHNRMHTEIYTLGNSGLVSCIPSGIVSKVWQYDKLINCCDIDNDGYLEAATVIQTPGGEEMPVIKYMEWADWTQETPQRRYYGVYDTRENLFVALPDEWQDNVHTDYSEDGFTVKEPEGDRALVSFTQIQPGTAVESGAYSYTVYLDTRMWHISFSEDMTMSQVEYVYKSVTDFN